MLILVCMFLEVGVLCEVKYCVIFIIERKDRGGGKNILVFDNIWDNMDKNEECKKCFV